MNCSPKSARSESNRVPTSRSPVKRRPSTSQPWVARCAIASWSSGDRFRSAARALPKAKGSDGCDSTGAIITSSSIIPSAKPPLKHMPTAPTPGPPTSRCNCLASARNHAMTGEVWPNASVVNSRDTHTLLIDDKMYFLSGARPTSPTKSGITTVNPASTTSSANFMTAGVMPGISCTTTTPGPLPLRYVSYVKPAAENESCCHPLAVAGFIT